MKKIRILVVDDQNVVREGMAAILSLQPDMEVVGEAEDGIQAVQIAQKTKPDVILLDMVMPHQDGLATIPKLKEISPNFRILVLSSFAESNRDVARGQASLHPSIAMKVIHDFNNPTNSENQFSEHLTPREMETLRLIAQGLSNQEIAMALVVHERTIAKYVSSILNKLHFTNRTQAALYALREGITT
jgi:NarL family two-component system response regulator LiaR